MPELTITELPVSELVEYENNAKLHPYEQIEQIAESISEFGNNDPIAVWHNENGEAEIVEGHGRLMALRRLGIETAPVIYLDHLTDEQRRAYALVHNKLTMNSDFDFDILQKELGEIATIDMEDFGFELDEEQEGDLEQINAEEDELPEVSEMRVRSGDIWQLGEHRLVCGDATRADVITALMGGETADLLLTDPPYGVSYTGKTADALTIQNDSMDGDEFVSFIEDSLNAANESMREGAAFYIWFAAWRTLEIFQACKNANYRIRQQLYWIKSNITLGHNDYQWQTEPCVYGWKEGAHWFAPTRKEHNIVDDMAEFREMGKAELLQVIDYLLIGNEETDAIREGKPNRNGEHPTMKPVSLFARLIRNSTKPGETVLDTFAGSGTTAIACEQMGRKARMCELSEGYCNVIIERWEQFTGKKAVLLENMGAR